MSEKENIWAEGSRREVYDMVMKIHRQIILDQKAPELSPMVFFAVTKDQVLPIAMAGGFRNSEEKDIFCAKMRILLKAAGAVRYVFVHEAWIVVLDKDEPLDDRPTPSKSERRVEALVSVVVDRDGMILSGQEEMIRDWKTGLVTGFKSMMGVQEYNVQDSPADPGRFATIFEDWGG